MVDGDIYSHGVPVEFFGRETRFPAGPGVLAQRTGALIICGYCERLEPGRFRIVMEPALDPARFPHTAALNAAVAAIVRAAHPGAPRPVVHLPADVGGLPRRRVRGGRGRAERRGVRIGIVSQSYYPRYGGVTEHVHHTAVELRRRGHQVTIITSRFRRGEAPSDCEVERIGYNLLIPFNGAFVDLAVGIRLRSQLRGLLRRHHFDILHTHAPLVPTLPLIAVETAECPQVGTFHTTSGPSRLIEAFQRRAGAARMQRLDARIAVSETARDFVAQYFPGDYVVIPNGVDTERFHPGVEPFPEWRDPGAREPALRRPPRPAQGRPGAARRHARGASRAPAAGRACWWWATRTCAGASRPPWPRRRGSTCASSATCSSRELPRWYATGDIFVSPALGHESFGIVLAEGMAAGRAVVASDIPGYRSVVQPGVNGLVSPPGDVAALADDPVRAWSRTPTAAPRSPATAGQRALEFAWPRVTDRIEAVYRDVLARRGGPAPRSGAPPAGPERHGRGGAGTPAAPPAELPRADRRPAHLHLRRAPDPGRALRAAAAAHRDASRSAGQSSLLLWLLRHGPAPARAPVLARSSAPGWTAGTSSG